MNRSVSDADLYLRGAETLLASWGAYARGATGAAVQRFPGVAVAVFPNEPERTFYNNALLDRDLAAAARAEALDAMEGAYAAAGVARFAAWVHESDSAMRGDLERRGYTVEEATRAMGMALDDMRLPAPEIELGPSDWFEYLRILGVRRASSACRSRRLPGPGRSTGWRGRRDGDGVRSWRRLRDLQRDDARARSAAGTGHRIDRPPRARRARARRHDGEPAVDGDGRARVRRRGIPRSGTVPRVRAVGAV